MADGIYDPFGDTFTFGYPINTRGLDPEAGLWFLFPIDFFPNPQVGVEVLPPPSSNDPAPLQYPPPAADELYDDIIPVSPDRGASEPAPPPRADPWPLPPLQSLPSQSPLGFVAAGRGTRSTPAEQRLLRGLLGPQDLYQAQAGAWEILKRVVPKILPRVKPRRSPRRTPRDPFRIVPDPKRIRRPRRGDPVRPPPLPAPYPLPGPLEPYPRLPPQPIRTTPDMPIPRIKTPRPEPYVIPRPDPLRIDKQPPGGPAGPGTPIPNPTGQPWPVTPVRTAPKNTPKPAPSRQSTSPNAPPGRLPRPWWWPLLDPWVQPLTRSEPGTRIQPEPNIQPEPLTAQPRPVPRPSSPAESLPDVLTEIVTDLLPLPEPELEPERDECECEEPQRKRKRPSSTVATIKSFARRMSQASLDNLK
jgi:hypothetical protein